MTETKMFTADYLKYDLGLPRSPRWLEHVRVLENSEVVVGVDRYRLVFQDGNLRGTDKAWMVVYRRPQGEKCPTGWEDGQTIECTLVHKQMVVSARWGTPDGPVQLPADLQRRVLSGIELAGSLDEYVRFRADAHEIAPDDLRLLRLWTGYQEIAQELSDYIGHVTVE